MQFYTGWILGFHGGICQSASDHGKVYIAGFTHGQKLVYGNRFFPPWLSRTWWTRQRWCWTALQWTFISMPVGLKKGIPRRSRTEQRRFDNESPCGNGWAWESIAFLLSRGNRNDICMAQALLEPFDLNDKLKKAVALLPLERKEFRVFISSLKETLSYFPERYAATGVWKVCTSISMWLSGRMATRV